MPIDQLLNQGNKGAALTGVLSGAAGGALISAFTNKKSAKKLLKAGGLVALGGAAWHAYRRYREQQDAATTTAIPELTRANFELADDGSANVMLLLEAMIAAGYADGHLNDIEQRRIWQQAVDQGLSGAALAQLSELLANPAPMDSIVARAGTMESKIEVYSASALALDDTCEAGQQYLARLADSLGLPGPLVNALHQQA